MYSFMVQCTCGRLELAFMIGTRCVYRMWPMNVPSFAPQIDGHSAAEQDQALSASIVHRSGANVWYGLCEPTTKGWCRCSADGFSRMPNEKIHVRLSKAKLHVVKCPSRQTNCRWSARSMAPVYCELVSDVKGGGRGAMTGGYRGV